MTTASANSQLREISWEPVNCSAPLQGVCIRINEKVWFMWNFRTRIKLLRLYWGTEALKGILPIELLRVFSLRYGCAVTRFMLYETISSDYAILTNTFSEISFQSLRKRIMMTYFPDDSEPNWPLILQHWVFLVLPTL